MTRPTDDGPDSAVALPLVVLVGSDLTFLPPLDSHTEIRSPALAAVPRTPPASGSTRITKLHRETTDDD